MASNIEGKRIAILATDGFEQAELMEPKKALDEAGAQTTIVSIKAGEIKGWAAAELGTIDRRGSDHRAGVGR